MMASSGNRVLMDQSKQTSVVLTNNINQQAADNSNPRAVQRCPRCDSSNTKFCYYNNYSLSQPRHFCKACKRYWTRGGTLRNVPVGGGCRKNKRVKKPNSSATPSHNQRDQIIGISKAAATSTNHHGTSLFYSNLPSNQLSDVNNLTIPRTPPSFVFSRETLANNGYDNILQPQFSGLGLNFSSTYLSSSSGTNIDNINGYKNGFNLISTTSNSLLSDFSLFGTTSTTSPTTLVTSSLENQKLNWSGEKESISIPNTAPYQELPFEVGEDAPRMVSVKVAESVKIEYVNNKNKLDWNSSFDQNSSLMNDQQNNIHIVGALGGGGGTNNWSDDLSHYGSSVPLDP